MMKSKRVKELEAQLHISKGREEYLEKQNKWLRDELTWAEGEIDFLNGWTGREVEHIEMRWYEKLLRKVFS